MKYIAVVVPAVLVLVVLQAGAPPAEVPEDFEISVDERLYHLGDSKKPEWAEFTTEDPLHPTKLELVFDVPEPSNLRVLELLAGEVNDLWQVILNGNEVGRLENLTSPRECFFSIPPGALKELENTLLVQVCCNIAGDDVYVGRVRLHSLSEAELRRQAEVTVHVRDGRSGDGIPCRLTVTRPSPIEDGKEELARLEVEREDRVAVRPGIIYTMDGAARFWAMHGRYTIYATRGFEYSVARAAVDLEPHDEADIDLVLEREVDTAGYLAADTHIHTVTHSHHGDATIQERVVTIAGEGVEVAIATDHNHHTDYEPVAREVGVDERFVSITGNELTTDIGHFNAFPIDKDSPPANHSHKDWVKLLKGLRETPGVRVVICNHPRRAAAGSDAFGTVALNPHSGEMHRAPSWLGLDAVEVINSKSLEKDHMVTFRDWLSLLNRGHRLSAVAGSDSHTVGGIVGQGRTYVRSSTDDPRIARIDELVESFLGGRLLVSLGLLADVRIDGRFGAGDLAIGLGASIAVDVKVTGPRWVRAGDVALYLNGELARRETIAHGEEDVVKYHATWTISKPPHDAHAVVIATGPPIVAPYWRLPEDDRYVAGATNPVWLDVDGDGRFTSAREYAEKIIKEHDTGSAALQVAARDYDVAVGLQVASIARLELQESLDAAYRELVDRARERLRDLRESATPGLRSAIDDYLEAAPPLGGLER